MKTENQLPKNIRQIGSPVGNMKVYIEDFVVTFLTSLTKDKNTFVRGAILFGEKTNVASETVIYIRGAIEAENLELDLSEAVFDDQVWRDIYQKKERFFPSLEVMGWALSRMGFSVRLNDKIKKTHFENFPGEGKVLYLVDHLDDEDAFYVYRGQDLVRQNGYFIYYEKNPMMQEYLVERSQRIKEIESYESMEEARRDEKIVRQFRHTIYQKTRKQKSRERVKKVSSSVATLLFLLMAGSLLYYSKIKGTQNLQDVINGAAQTMGRGVERRVSTAKTTEKIISTQAVSVTEKKTEEKKKEIPKTTTEKATTKKSNRYIYTVKKGDNLVNIARKFYGSRKFLYRIADANGISQKEKIYPGQKLSIPSISN